MFSRRRGVVLGWLALMLAALGGLHGRLSLNTDMAFFLPPAGAAQQQLVLDELREGAAARLLILAIEAADTQQAAQLSTAMAEALDDEPVFAQVLNRPAMLDDEQEDEGFRYRYLFSPPDWDALPHSLRQRLDELNSPLAAFTRRHLASDPTASYRHWLESMRGEGGARLRHGVWFDGEGRALLLLRTRAAGMDLAAQDENIRLIRQHFKRFDPQGQARLQLGGAPALAVTSRDTIQAEARMLSIAASLAVMVILLWAYRSLRLWLLAALPLATAVVSALLAVMLLFGQVHGITLAFGITLIGVALDYPLHLFSHLRRGQAPGEAMSAIWPTLRLGVLSTALGYLAMILSGFHGLMQLGVFASVGLLAAALCTRWVLPALLPTRWNGGEVRSLRFVPSFSTNRAQWVIGLFATGALMILLFSPRPLWQQDIAALSPVPESQRVQEGRLRAALGVPDLAHLLLLQGDSAEAVLQRSEALWPALRQWQAEGVIADFELAARWLPSVATQRQRQQALPSRSALREQLAAAQVGLPFREDAFEPFIRALEASRQLPPLSPQDLADDGLLRARIAPLLFEREGQWWAQVPLRGVGDPALLAQRTAEQEGVLYLDLAAATGRMLDGFRSASLSYLALGAALIAVLLWWGLGSARHAARVLLPVGGALLSTMALLHLFGELLSLFHLVALLLVLGIGLDYSLFFSRGGDDAARGRTAHALGLCAISSLSVFAILSLSQLPVLHAIGLTVTLGILSSFLFAWMLASRGSAST